MGNSVLAWDLQFIERTVSLFNGIYCFTMILSHFGDVTCRYVAQITVEPTPPGPRNGDRRKWPLWGGCPGVI